MPANIRALPSTVVRDKEIRIEEVENGYIVNLSHTGGEGESSQYINKRFIALTEQEAKTMAGDFL